MRRKNYSETRHISNKTVEKWAQKQQRVAAAGCRMSGIGRRGQWCRGRYGAVSATAKDTHDKFPRPHHNEGKDYADGEDKGWRDAQRGVDKGVLNHGVVHYEVVVCLVSLMAGDASCPHHLGHDSGSIAYAEHIANKPQVCCRPREPEERHQPSEPADKPWQGIVPVEDSLDDHEEIYDEEYHAS